MLNNYIKPLHNDIDLSESSVGQTPLAQKNIDKNSLGQNPHRKKAPLGQNPHII